MTVRFVDFSATNNGDGTTAAQAGAPAGVGAYNTLVAVTLTASDTVWIRRAGTLTLAASFSFNAASGISYIGWPISTDEDFSTRPASGTSNGWDADSSATLPTISFNFNTSAFTINTATASISITVKRMLWNQTSAASSTLGAIQFNGTSNILLFKYMQFTSIGTGTGSLINNSNTSGTCTFNFCTFSVVGATTGFFATSASKLAFFDCIFSKTAPATGGTLLNINSTSTSGEINRSTFTVSGSGVVSCSCIITSNSAAASPLIFNDCTLDNSVCTTFSEAIATFNGETIVNNMSTKGSNLSISAASISTFGFSQVLQTIPISTGFINNPAGFLFTFYAANLTTFPGNTNDATILDGTLYIFNNPLFCAPLVSRYGGIFPTGTMYYGNYNKTSGAFCGQTQSGLVQSNYVNRSGGETYSLMFNYTGGTLPIRVAPLEVGLPGMETIFVSLASGARTITLYGAYRGYITNPTNNDIWFDTTYLTGASGAACAVASSGSSAALTSDTSTWLGDSSLLTPFKMVISVTAGQACVCPIRIKMNKNDPNGFIFIDPLAIVT